MTQDQTPLIVEARGVSKRYGKFHALKDINFTLPAGRVLGIIGANGAGKTTLLNALLGLHSYDGELSVLGLDPYSDRAALMRDVSFISDVATLPKWMRVSDVLRYVEDVHPNFDRAAAEQRLAATTSVTQGMKIKNLSKGMTVQLHLAIVLAIDAKLLVLDEPTLGLDIIHRRNFYDALITEFCDHERSVIITTHQVDEIDQILSHAIFLREGEIVLDAGLDTLSERFLLLEAPSQHASAVEAIGPMFRRAGLGRTTYLFDGAQKAALAEFGDVRRAGLADLFIAKMQPELLRSPGTKEVPGQGGEAL